MIVSRFFAYSAALAATVAWVYVSFFLMTSDGESVLETEGVGIPLLLFVPILVSLYAIYATRQRYAWLIIGGLALFTSACVIIWSLSVGLFFAPTALALIVSSLFAAVGGIRNKEKRKRGLVDGTR